MSPNHSTRSVALGIDRPFTHRRLTPRQTADVLGITVDQVMRLSAKGGRFFDPTFPPMHRGAFDETAVMKARDNRAAQSSTPAASPPRRPPPIAPRTAAQITTGEQDENHLSRPRLPSRKQRQRRSRVADGADLHPARALTGTSAWHPVHKLDKGLITPEEFDKKRAEILNSL